MKFIFVARETWPVWTTARASDAMAIHTELLSRAPVTAGASHRIEARLMAMITAAFALGQPVSRVRTTNAFARRYLSKLVTFDARLFAVAGGAKSRLGTCFVRMPRPEASAMKTVQPDLIEREASRQSGDGADAVARRARTLGVTRSAQIARTCGLRTMLTQPIAVVYEVTRGQGSFTFKIDMAAVTVARCPLLFVLVT